MTRGLEESLESFDACQNWTGEPTTRTVVSVKEKLLHRYGPNFELLPLAIDKKKRCKCEKYIAMYMFNRVRGEPGELRCWSRPDRVANRHIL